MFLAVMIYTCLFLRRFQLEPKGFSRSIEFYKHKMMAVDRCPPLPIDLDSHAKLRIILRSLLVVFYPPGGGVWRAEVDSGVDDI